MERVKRILANLVSAIAAPFRSFFSGRNAEESVATVYLHGFERSAGNLADIIVVQEEFMVPDFQANNPGKSDLLFSDHELYDIDRVIRECTALEELLSPKAKTTWHSLKTLFAQYNHLRNRLEDVEEALSCQDKSKIKDELIAFNEVEIPVLLVKQYKKEAQWHHVPACSYITDKDGLLAWLKVNPKHPLNKDVLNHPPPYKGMECRYIWYELGLGDCTSRELDEALIQMRVLSQELVQSAELTRNTSSTGSRIAP